MMREITTLLDVICSFLETFWLYSFVNSFFQKRYISEKINKREKLVNIACIILSGSIVIGINYIVLTSPYTTFFWMFSGIVCTCIFWKSDLLSASAVIGMYAFVLFIYSNIIITIINAIGGKELLYSITVDKGILRLIFLLFYQAIWALINILLFKARKRIYLQNNVRQLWFISVIGLIGSTFFAVQMLKCFEIRINFMWYIFLIFIILLIYGMYYKERKEAYQKELDMMIKHNNLLEKNYEQISAFYSENAKLYHDMKHHFNMLYSLIETGKQDSAKEYLEKIIKPVEVSKVPIRSGIEMLDVVLFEMEKKAQDKKITIEFLVQSLPREITIDKKDLCILFVNLLDNAIEAAKSQVIISISQVHKMLIVRVTNDYKNKPKNDGKRFISTKQDRMKHGWGIKIIEQIIQNYDGSIEYKVDEKFVIIDIMINVI